LRFRESDFTLENLQIKPAIGVVVGRCGIQGRCDEDFLVKTSTKQQWPVERHPTKRLEREHGDVDLCTAERDGGFNAPGFDVCDITVESGQRAGFNATGDELAKGPGRVSLLEGEFQRANRHQRLETLAPNLRSQFPFTPTAFGLCDGHSLGCRFEAGGSPVQVEWHGDLYRCLTIRSAGLFSL
jgi:hypothetical protein